MHRPVEKHPEQLISRAHMGDATALDELLGCYRNYLDLLARTQMGTRLGLRVDPSDLTQDVMVVAYRKFEQFRGTTEPELAAWLRRIFVRKLADQIKRHHAQRRDLRREVSLEAALGHSSQNVEQALVASLGSPSSQAIHREEAVLLADALARLPSDYREVLIMRHIERLPVDQIAERMGRSEAAVRKLWARALNCFHHGGGEL
jgi:RNA polymerase sigma-70 factor (ECF subfamily)